MTKITLDVPDEFLGLVETWRETLEDMKGIVARTGGGKSVDYAKVERAIAENARQSELESHRAILEGLDIDVPAVVIGGIRYTRVGRCEAPYHTRAGSVSIERSLYRRSGTRGGEPEAKVVDPIGLRIGAVGDGWLPGTARVMSHQVQKGTSREAEETAREYALLPYSRSSFEAVAHLVGALAMADKRDIEDALIDAYEVPKEAQAVSVSLDRVSVPMEEPRRRPVGRPRKDAPKKPVERKFRMAYCGTITVHDANGEALHTIRYGAMPGGDINGLRNRLVEDAATLLSKNRGMKLELLCDGAPEMWSLLEEGFTEDRFGDKVYRLVDYYHLTEKLAPAAKKLDQQEPQQTFKRWKMRLFNASSAAKTILTELVASGMDEGPGEKHPVHAAITYLQSHCEDADRMNYARARRNGLPLGSGNVEATCKSLFEMRLKRCGSRWKNETGQHIVQLRAMALSDRWGPFVELTLRPLKQAVRVA